MPTGCLIFQVVREIGDIKKMKPLLSFTSKEAAYLSINLNELLVIDYDKLHPGLAIIILTLISWGNSQ